MNRIVLISMVSLVFLTLLASNVIAQAQDQYLVYGYVYDEEGDPVDGAVITAENRRTHEEIELVSNADGEYVFSILSFEEGYEDSDNILLTAELGGESGSVLIDIEEGEIGVHEDITFGEMANVADDDTRSISSWVYLLIFAVVIALVIIIYVLYTKSKSGVM